MIQKSNLEMLGQLKVNNNREWFTGNKNIFQRELFKEEAMNLFYKH